MTHYAHSLAGRPEKEWQPLDEHLNATAERADRFTEPFAPGCGRLAGLLHDAGKYQREFQDYIRQDAAAHVGDRVDHSTVGALMVRDRAPLLAFVIAGHHGGLANASALRDRLEKKKDLLPNARDGGLPRWLEELVAPTIPSWLLRDRLLMSMWTRFIFSALVDADFLDTERFYAGGKERPVGASPSLRELKARLDAHLTLRFSGSPATAVNEMRARVLDASRRAAKGDTGAFTMTVPTGGGKTLASLAFALDHAVAHGLSRVIVVIPYTSIIEQTAQGYREALGDEAVLEHHTNIDPDRETPANRLASENWDAPVVVTTSVQFFESLYANRTSRCRKVHRIARSVVVFDEVQTFPANLLLPVKHALGELVSNYGSTALLCTATQPVLLDNAREIISEPAKEFASVAGRCEVLLPGSEEPESWESLAAELRLRRQVLAIVHRRDDAQRLAELIGQECLHLSARMCAAHRTVVLAEAKGRLSAGLPCQLVATQLVEAGVDIDFPEVYRAFAGADSLAQAAGRCNREGRGEGVLHIFFGPTRPPRGILQTGERVAMKMWREKSLNLSDPDTFARYFAQLYPLVEQDSKGVMTAERGQRFADVADLFQMIPESGEPVVAPYGDWESLLANVRREGVTRIGMRRLQRFMVSLYRQEIETLCRAGALERIHDTFWAVVPGYNIYSSRWGFGWKGAILPEPETLIA